MKLFELINHQVVISEEAYLLSPFKKIWDADKSKNKAKASAELAYIFFMEDFRSDFLDIFKEEDKRQQVLSSIELPDDYIETELVKEARAFYRERINNILPLLYLQDAKIAVNEMRAFFKGVDFSKKDNKGKPIYDADKLSATISKSYKLLTDLDQLEELVKKELQARDDMIGGKSKAVFEDGI